MNQRAPHELSFRWLMLAGASLVYACFGALMAAPAVLVQPITASLGLTAFQMGSILGAWQFAYLFFAIPVGAAIDRFGLRPCLAVAGLVMALSAFMRAMADSYVGLLIAVLILGIGGPLISVGAPKLVSRWFVGAERGLAMGIYSSSMVVGALLALLGTNSVVMPLVGYDWQRAFGIYALLMLVGVIVWIAIASHPLSRLGNTRVNEPNARVNTRVFRQLLRGADVRLILMMAICIFFFGHGLSAWLPEILRDHGLSVSAAANWSALPMGVAVIATLIVPRLATVDRRISIMSVLAIAGILSLAILAVQPLWQLIASLVAQGFARSCLLPIAVLMLMESRSVGENQMGAASGLFFTAAEIGGVGGPLVCGWLIGATGDYSSALWACALAMVVLLILLAKHALGRRDASDE